MGLAVYSLVATGTDPASWTWTIGQNAAGAISVYRNVDPASPVDGQNGQTRSGAAQTTPSIIATQIDELSLASFAIASTTSISGTDNWASPPTGMTERADVANTATTWVAVNQNDHVETSSVCCSSHLPCLSRRGGGNGGGRERSAAPPGCSCGDRCRGASGGACGKHGRRVRRCGLGSPGRVRDRIACRNARLRVRSPAGRRHRSRVVRRTFGERCLRRQCCSCERGSGQHEPVLVQPLLHADLRVPERYLGSSPVECGSHVEHVQGRRRSRVVHVLL